MSIDIIDYSGVDTILCYQLATLMLVAHAVEEIADRDDLSIDLLTTKVNLRIEKLFGNNNTNYQVNKILANHAVVTLKSVFNTKVSTTSLFVTLTHKTIKKDPIPAILNIPMCKTKFQVKFMSSYFKLKDLKTPFGSKATFLEDKHYKNNNDNRNIFIHNVTTLANDIYLKKYRHNNPYSSLDACISSCTDKLKTLPLKGIIETSNNIETSNGVNACSKRLWDKAFQDSSDRSKRHKLSEIFDFIKAKSPTEDRDERLDEEVLLVGKSLVERAERNQAKKKKDNNESSEITGNNYNFKYHIHFLCLITLYN